MSPDGPNGGFKGTSRKRNLRYQKGNLINKKEGYNLTNEMIAGTPKEDQFGSSSRQAGVRKLEEQLQDRGLGTGAHKWQDDELVHLSDDE